MKPALWISGIVAVLSALLMGATKGGLLPIPPSWDDAVLYTLIISGVIWAGLFLAYCWPPSNNSLPKEGAGSHTVGDQAVILLALKEIKDLVLKSATASTVTAVQTNVGTRMVEMERTLLRNISIEAVKAVEASELGALRSKLAEQERMLEEARKNEVGLGQRIDEEVARCAKFQADLASADRQLESLRNEKSDLERNLAQSRTSLGEQQRLFTAVQNDLETKKKECEEIRADADKPYRQLAPHSLRDSELASAMASFFAESVGGQTAAISVWSVLTAFGAAQGDAAARDFQLQIVRRLGVVLVQYWKQKGFNDKERHEQLTVWAKCLNEHADGRYNLFVPGLGTPVDRARMACITSATTVHEVLCWQVRNPTGANFSLAEVA